MTRVSPGSPVELSSLEETLNKRSGLSGLSGLPGDTRVILPKARGHNRRAKLAIDVFIHRLRAGIGSMLASLGHLGVLVFTDAIGESEPSIRGRVSEAFSFLGLRLDEQLNLSSPFNTDIAVVDSTARVLIVRGDENWEIAAESLQALRDHLETNRIHKAFFVSSRFLSGSSAGKSHERLAS